MTRFFSPLPALFLLFLSLGIDRPIVAQNPFENKLQFAQALKEGVLLIRLQDKEKSIAELQERGMQKQALKMAQRQARENKEILLSFKTTFDFCPVYFFYAKDSEAIRAGDFAGKVFDLERQLVSVPKERRVFTGFFGETEELGTDGFIVHDDQILPFQGSLPYFERRYGFFGLIEKSKAKMLKNYNKRLWNLIGA